MGLENVCHLCVPIVYWWLEILPFFPLFFALGYISNVEV